MLQLSGVSKIYLAVGVTDMRKSFDTLGGIVRSWRDSGANPETVVRDGQQREEESPGPDPLDGSLYVFCNRRRDRIKVLMFDGTGLVLLSKRLERGTFSWPGSESGARGGECVITQHELAMLLGGVDMSQTKRRRWWRRIG